jgi:hypothetical protein
VQAGRGAMQQHDGFRILWRTFVAQVDLHPIDRDELRMALAPSVRSAIAACDRAPKPASRPRRRAPAENRAQDPRSSSGFS